MGREGRGKGGEGRGAGGREGEGRPPNVRDALTPLIQMLLLRQFVLAPHEWKVPSTVHCQGVLLGSSIPVSDH